MTLPKKKADEDVDLDQEIDVVSWSRGAQFQPVKAEEDPNATENSSSFGDTFSGSDSESKRDFSDIEVESGFAPMSREHAVEEDGFGRGFRKKKVTAHWRKFISPLTWRCRWLELRTKELLLQASKYDKELAACKREKELRSTMVGLEFTASKLIPIEPHNHRKELMRRRERKPIEDKVDVSSYMSNHVIFSYYENKRTETDGHLVDNDCNDMTDDHLKINDDSEWMLGLNGSDSVEQILLNIDSIQSRIAMLKSHLNKAVGRRANEGSLLANLVPRDPPASFAQNVGDSGRNNNGGAGTIGIPSTPSLHFSEDAGMPQSAVSNFGDSADPDILGSTSGLLSAVNGNHQIGALSKFAEEDILIDNQVAEEEFQNYEKVSNAIEKKPPGVVTKESEMQFGHESSALKKIKKEPGVEKEKPLEVTLKARHSGKSFRKATRKKA